MAIRVPLEIADSDEPTPAQLLREKQDRRIPIPLWQQLGPRLCNVRPRIYRRRRGGR